MYYYIIFIIHTKKKNYIKKSIWVYINICKYALLHVLSKKDKENYWTKMIIINVHKKGVSI